MTKKNMIKEVRDVMTGRSGHTYISVSKKGRSWQTETNINRIDDDNAIFEVQHCCNEMSLREIEDYLKNNCLWSTK